MEFHNPTWAPKTQNQNTNNRRGKRANNGRRGRGGKRPSNKLLQKWKQQAIKIRNFQFKSASHSTEISTLQD